MYSVYLFSGEALYIRRTTFAILLSCYVKCCFNVLIECADFFCGPLCKIHTKSLDEGKLLYDCTSAIVTPLHKKGSRTKPENYRPVSLTSIPCNVLESLIRDQLLEHIKVHKLASTHQHGFISGRSCFTNLLEAIEDWTRAYDEGLDVGIVYLDYRKAFDTVPHKRLIKKLKAYRISGTPIGWIESFVTKRQMRVRINGKMSRWIDVLSSVPQSFVLGPLLFLLFVNEIPNLIDSSIRLFADDTKVWRVN